MNIKRSNTRHVKDKRDKVPVRAILLAGKIPLRKEQAVAPCITVTVCISASVVLSKVRVQHWQDLKAARVISGDIDQPYLDPLEFFCVIDQSDSKSGLWPFEPVDATG